jgi:hypothetical protein
LLISMARHTDRDNSAMTAIPDGQRADATGKTMKSIGKARRFGAMSVLLLGLATGGLTACGLTEVDNSATSSAAKGSAPGARVDLGTLTYRAVDLMMSEAVSVPAGTPMVVATVANADDLNQSSPLGNMVSDLVRSRLVQAGANVSEMRLRSAVNFDRRNGEMMLSRQAGRLIRPPETAMVVTGTYAAGFNRVYVSLKMVAVADGRIIAGADFSVPRGGEVEGLIRRQVAGNY